MLLSEISTVPDKGMNTYAMESLKLLIFFKFAKMLKMWIDVEKSDLKQFNIRQQHNKT